MKELGMTQPDVVVNERVIDMLLPVEVVGVWALTLRLIGEVGG